MSFRNVTGGVASILLLASCTQLGLNTASARIDDQDPATPSIETLLSGEGENWTLQRWQNELAPRLRAEFEDYLYGPIPVELDGVEVSRRMVDPDFAGGIATLEEILVRVGTGENAIEFHIGLAVPKAASAEFPAPLILNESFSDAGTAFGRRLGGIDPTDPDSMMARTIRLIFGKYIMEGPNTQILSRGYAYAVFSPGEIVADRADAASIGLGRLAAMLPADRAPSGAIGVWAAAFSWAIDALDADARLDPARTAIWGHSREGKAALVAAAFDDRIEATISHQSGKGGGALTRSYAGESVKQVTKSYPHWFAPAYAEYAGEEAKVPIDQHELIALVAPRPVLLGNGWKDVWSDPNGSFRAAVGADPVYQLFGVPGLKQEGMRSPAAGGALEFFIRPGGHGVREVDWNYFLDWLDMKFSTSSGQTPESH